MRRKLPDNCHLAYTISHEAWYWRPSPASYPTIMVCAAADDGRGIAWEFAVEEHDLDGKTIRICLYGGEELNAYLQIPDFFRELAVLNIDSLDDVQAVLDELGAADETPRHTPERYRDAAEIPLRERIIDALSWSKDAARAADIVVALLARDENYDTGDSK